MIDFRYHLVSLISVFLALALGIVLGAGPLNQTIGDQLTGQVEELRADRDGLRAQLDESEAARESLESYLSDAAPQLLGSRLEGRPVAIVTLPETRDEDVTEIRRAVELSGATVTAEVQVLEGWTDPDTASFRDSFAGQVFDYLATAPEGSPGSDHVLALALAQSLTDADVDGTPSETAETLLDLLTQVSEPLVEIVSAPEEAATSTIVVGPPTWAQIGGDPEDEEAVAEQDRVLASQVQFAEAFAATGEGGVLVGSARVSEDLVTAVRADDSAASVVTTIDGVTSASGWVTTPMALAATIAGNGSHYGFGIDAEAGLPDAVYLPPPATETPEENATDEGTTEEEPTSDTDTDGQADDADDDSADSALGSESELIGSTA